MTVVQKISSSLNQFKSNEKGSIIPMTALMMSTLLVAAGAAYDYSILSRSQFKMNNALDSAILATGKQLLNGETSEAKLRQRFEDFYFTNLTGLGAPTTDHTIVEFNVDFNTGEVKAVTQSTYNTSFMAVTGLTSLDVVSEGAGIFEQKETEVALMLDVTGSMRHKINNTPNSKTKLQGLQEAATAAIKILLNDNNDKVRVALAPYSESVNADIDIGGQQTLADLVTEGKSTSCVTERDGPQEATDATYRNNALRADSDFCPTAKVNLLTNRKQQLIDEIAGLTHGGFTAGHLGIAWSYYMLSPNWDTAFPNSSKPADYSKDVTKIAILMTDGIFNKAYTGVEGPARSTQLSKDLCADMKAVKNGNPGITIYSIAFAAEDSEALLKECATPDTSSTQYFYSAATNEELIAAFTEIAQSIQTLRLSR